MVFFFFFFFFFFFAGANYHFAYADLDKPILRRHFLTAAKKIWIAKVVVKTSKFDIFHENHQAFFAKFYMENLSSPSIEKKYLELQPSGYSAKPRKTWKIRGKFGKIEKSEKTWKTKGNILESHSTRKNQGKFLNFRLICWCYNVVSMWNSVHDLSEFSKWKDSTYVFVQQFCGHWSL